MHAAKPHMTSIIAILIALLTCVTALVGCAGQQDAPAPSTTQMKESVPQEEAAQEEDADPADPADADEPADEPSGISSLKDEPVADELMFQAQSAAREALAGYNDVAVTVISTDGDTGFQLQGKRTYVSASMIKLLVLAEFMKQVDEGVISLDGTYALAAKDVVGGTAHIANSSTGTEFTYDDLAKFMICYSDNTATNVLIRTLGADRINKRADELGLKSTELNRKMMDLDSGVENYMSTDDAAAILLGIANNSIASRDMCERARTYLLAQTDNEGLAQGLPDGTELAHKTGTLDVVRHDAGIVIADYPYVIACFSEDNSAETANRLAADVASAVNRVLNAVAYQ